MGRIQQWDCMELDAENGSKQVEYCDVGFIIKPLSIFSLHSIQTQFVLLYWMFYRSIIITCRLVLLYSSRCSRPYNIEYDFMGGFMRYNIS